MINPQCSSTRFNDKLRLFTARSVVERTCIECVNEVEDRGIQPKSKLFGVCINDTNGIQVLQALRPMNDEESENGDIKCGCSWSNDI